ncbi:hypothetical protein [Bacillus wiedmannii]|uniref:hypothetical protein n=1 Tax=Bacillus wiedmannii TaxID=1890302 RepID=UPI000BF15D86|nr:hypothetical protein [Bacillus wiedmannii]PEM08536.1 hypothetical protein CN610_19995 [Bacillus wiedmannii]
MQVITDVKPKVTKKPEGGDLVRVTWYDGHSSFYVIHFRHRKVKLVGIHDGGTANGEYDTIEAALQDLEKSSVVQSFEVLPKSEYQLKLERKAA